jgi:hypothetical protein
MNNLGFGMRLDSLSNATTQQSVGRTLKVGDYIWVRKINRPRVKFALCLATYYRETADLSPRETAAEKRRPTEAKGESVPLAD